jgi:NADH:ubiquinone oxidoreductase subunit F (NADH-binding)
MSLPRLLAGLSSSATVTAAEHEATHGPLKNRGTELMEIAALAGLRGRGGASFPTAVKLRGVALQPGPRTVLVNGAESEPMSFKDRVLLEYVPHLVLDGACVAAKAIGANRVIVAIREDAPNAIAATRHAVNERGLRRRIKVVGVPTAHLAGQESALVSHLNGGPLKPSGMSPRPFERGVKRRPTLVQNPETLAHLALIDRHGPEWFREVGTKDHPGSALVTVAGAVRRTGVREIACGTGLEEVLQTDDTLRAVLVGGYHGVWIGAEDIGSVQLDDNSLRKHGGGLAAGVIVALGASACPVQEIARTITWLADQSAHQCGPCSNGLPAIAGLLESMAAGRAPTDSEQRLRRWSKDVSGRGACHLPDGAMRFLGSGLRVFEQEFADHLRHGPCVACRQAATLTVTPHERRAAA